MSGRIYKNPIRMICPKCAVEMLPGQALPSDDPNERPIVACITILNADTAHLIDCWKCPKCGHSDDGVVVVNKYIGD